MAIPFIMPHDEVDHLITTVILILSQTRLDSSDGNRDLRDCIEDLVMLLREEYERRYIASQMETDITTDTHRTRDTHLRVTLALLSSSLNRIPASGAVPRPRRRTTSESSCCNKEAEHGTVQETPQTNAPEEIAAPPSLVLRLFPVQIRYILTVLPIIVIVGWHLLETAYFDCM